MALCNRKRAREGPRQGERAFPFRCLLPSFVTIAIRANFASQLHNISFPSDHAGSQQHLHLYPCDIQYPLKAEEHRRRRRRHQQQHHYYYRITASIAAAARSHRTREHAALASSEGSKG